MNILGLNRCDLGLGVHRNDVNEAPVVFASGKGNHSAGDSKNSVVFANGYAFAGVIGCAPLPNDDVSGLGNIASKYFYPQSLAMRFSSVLYLSFSFLMSHFLQNLW
jgi:hypothetical protein